MQARVDHSVHLETRLLTTLDTLDEIQAVTAFEYRQSQEENARLHRKLRAAAALARNAQEEKDAGATSSEPQRKKIVVVGLGMVGIAFV